MLFHKITPLADNYVKVFSSPDPNAIHLYSPGIAILNSGRIIVTMDIGGPGVELISGDKCIGEYNLKWQGKIFISDDEGYSWHFKANFPFMHARPFTVGNSLYIIGHSKNIMIIRSDDDGETWSEPYELTSGEIWHSAPCNVYYKDKFVYLVMEKITDKKFNGWPVSVLAPILLRGNIDSDLTCKGNWTFASELSFKNTVNVDDIDYFGIPFFNTPIGKQTEISNGRIMAPCGWLEGNIVQFIDSNNYLYDPSGHTFHIWLRAHTAMTGYAAILKVIEKGDKMVTSLEYAPSGKKLLFVPCPGGHLKFHIVYDDKLKLYWLLSSQATDSMTRADRLPNDRVDLPNNERNRLQLHFSKNCIDWCFAGIVSIGGSQKESRHYASMAIKGNDLLIVSRSGDKDSKDAHNGNIITFHKVNNFRELVY